MLETNFSHALGLHMHQPPGNLALLIEANPWEAEQIIRCYERPTRYARQYADVGHLHIGFSGILLEQFLDPDIVDCYRHILDIPAMLDAYRETPNIELIGMGYFHPIFPLIPPADWEEQLRRGRELMQEVFGRAPKGFWPPEMAFSMEMIPALVRAGYEYVVVDGVHVHPEDGITDVFRPYLACHDGECISVVPRDRDVSNAQESGLDASWFAHEVTHRCRFSPRPDEPRLCTTWSDGENGGWFRQTHEGSGFFGHYYSPYMEHVRGGEYPIRPVGLSAYLAEHPPAASAHVQTGAWNVGSTSGFDLSQWAGSEGQRQAVQTVRDLSRRWWALREAPGLRAPESASDLARARRLVLEAETSCYLFWGDDWLPKLVVLTDAADALLSSLEAAPVPAPAAASEPAPAEVQDRAEAKAAAPAQVPKAEREPEPPTQSRPTQSTPTEPKLAEPKLAEPKPAEPAAASRAGQKAPLDQPAPKPTADASDAARPTLPEGTASAPPRPVAAPPAATQPAAKQPAPSEPVPGLRAKAPGKTSNKAGDNKSAAPPGSGFRGKKKPGKRS